MWITLVAEQVFSYYARMEARRDEYVARARGRKAMRIINHLDAHFSRRVTFADVADWREVQWRRSFTRAGERWNAQDPWPTIDAVVARLKVRDRVDAERTARESHALAR